ncbi:hypothetical protein MJN85_29340, partial [Salmonella enterica subsp. enterica serovar Anatum]|nr:hypothetical protein [Salmonella enterica subsp. enterica serovar Anatum]
LQKTDGFDTWDIDSLEKDIRLGLKKVCNEGILIDSIGIDTWGENLGAPVRPFFPQAQGQTAKVDACGIQTQLVQTADLLIHRFA